MTPSLRRHRFWAIGCLQLYLYYEVRDMHSESGFHELIELHPILQRYWTTDRTGLKAYVALTWAVDTGHQVLTLVFLYGVFVRGIVDPTRLFAWPK